MARGKKHPEPEKENHERWLITYADLITLLMVFFVVLYSMARADESKFQRVSASLQQAFNVDVLQGSTTSSLGGDAPGSATTVVEDVFISPDSAYNPEAQKLEARLKSTIRGTPPELTSPDVAVGATPEGIVVRLSGSFLFDSGRADIKPNALPILDTLAAELRAVGNEVRIDGHTDSIPVDSARFPTNWELSAARAVAVARYLSEAGGVPAARLSTAGYGEFRPLVNNETRENRALNRRVEIRILAPEVEAPVGPEPLNASISPNDEATSLAASPSSESAR